MVKYEVICGSTAKKSLEQDYASVLNSASTELSEAEYRHLADIANIGYEHAVQKDDYVEALHDTISDWFAEARRTQFHLVKDSAEIDFRNWYNDTNEVKEYMRPNQSLSVIPAFFVCFGAISLALFCIFATILVIGIYQRSFFINPVYLFMFVVGFLGLLLTDITAIAEWRQGRNGRKQAEP